MLSDDIKFIADFLKDDYTFANSYCETSNTTKHIFEFLLDFDNLDVKNYVIIYPDKGYVRELVNFNDFEDSSNEFILQFESKMNNKNYSMIDFLKDVEGVMLSLEGVKGFINKWEILENFPCTNTYCDNDNNKIMDVYCVIIKITVTGNID